MTGSMALFGPNRLMNETDGIGTHSLSDELVVASAKLVRLNHVFQKLVAELGLPLQTYLSRVPTSPSALAGPAPPAVTSNGTSPPRHRQDSASPPRPQGQKRGNKLTPQRLLALLLLAGQSPEEDLDRATSSSSSPKAVLAKAGFFSALEDPESSSQDAGAARMDGGWPEEVRRDMNAWEAERGDKDPWEVYRRRLAREEAGVEKDQDEEMQLGTRAGE